VVVGECPPHIRYLDKKDYNIWEAGSVMALPKRWSQHGPLKCWYPTISLQCHNPEDHDMIHHLG